MGFEEILEEMEDILEESWKVPMGGGKSVVDVPSFEKLIRDLRLSVPREIIEANRIVDNKKQIIQEAKDRCEEIYKIAKKKVASMAEEHEIVKIAKDRETLIMKECMDHCKEISSKMRESALENLSCCEKSLLAGLEEIKKMKQDLKIVKIKV